MKFTQNGNTMGDEMTPYIVTEYKARTVREFIAEVLALYPKEWGKIKVKRPDSGWLFSPYCEYRYGTILRELPPELLDLEIRKVESCGGWSAMDYLIWDTTNNND